jgi:dTDP-4-dehydrorhamnose 3,5-epimerase
MLIKKSPVLKLLMIHPKTNFKDNRGRYIQSFSSKDYKKILNHKFVEDDFSLNKKNVFKGFHGDHKTWKLASCVHGKCEAVIVNFDKKSNQFGMWEKFILSPNPYIQILIPPSYGNSFLVLSDYAVYHYKQTKYYSGKDKQFTINYKDPFFKIKLSSKKIIISKRDKDANFIKI